MTDTEQYDAIVIGAGQGGGPLATALGKAGWKTALVERDRVGGTCINRGCTPTKTMVASAHAAYLARRAVDYGVTVGAVSVDLAAVRARKQAIVDDFHDGSLRRIEDSAGVDLVRGEARFTGPYALAVQMNDGGVRRLHAPKIVIDAGGRPARPPLPGLDSVGALDSTTVMELDDLPEHLLILGGGYVAVEFGQMYRRFGSQVTIVQRGDQLLDREDADVAGAVADILRQDGIRLLLGSAAQRVACHDGCIALDVKNGHGEETLYGSHLLVAVGRVPNTDRLNLAAAGIESDARGHICVNERLETTVPGIYALGDVTGGPAFTHISYDDFRILRTNLLEGGAASTAGRLVPYVVYMDPQLGRVGLSEQEARAQGREYRVATLPMSGVARAIEVSQERGFMKAIVDPGSRQILGCAVLGAEGGEIMAMMQIAMMAGLPYTALRDGVFAHPSLAESLNNLFAGIEE